MVVALSVTAGVAGTMAYLQDDDSDVNVMTLGNVSITQHEYQRAVNEDGTYKTATIDDRTSYVLEPFKQGKDLLPSALNTTTWEGWDWDGTPVRMSQVGSYGGMSVFKNAANAQDKFVTVENTGKTDAYVRTLIAIEVGDSDISLFGLNAFLGVWTENEIGKITVDRNNYYVLEYVYNGASDVQRHVNGVLPAGDTTYPNLAQVYIHSKATNEDMEAIDGNDNGVLDILVLSQAVQVAGFEDAKTALDTAFGTSSEKAAEWFGGVIAEHAVDKWDGTADTTWYNETDTEFKLSSAEAVAGLAELVNNGTDAFAGKTITLDKNVDLSGNNFTPIGGVDKGYAFEGTFDGQDHTISGLSENGWELGYEYGDQAGMGLFGWIYNTTIKNVTIDEAEVSMEAVVMGTVAGYATGNCTFENITVSNTQIANYNWDTGGIVGQVYGNGDTFTFKNINIDETTTISGHWGTWDVSAGGVIGRTANGVNVVMEDVKVAARLDVYNDVCAAYQWYAYRYSGMLVGYTKTTETIDGRTVATAPHVTCKNVTVIYDDWANYTYCQASNVAPQYVRVQGGYSTDPYYSGRHWTAGVDAAGNKMVDDNHVHNEGEAHNELIVFDQLFGGGQGVYGTATHEGVTVIYNNK